MSVKEDESDYTEIRLKIKSESLWTFYEGLITICDSDSMDSVIFTNFCDSISESINLASEDVVNPQLANQCIDDIIEDFQKISHYSSSHKLIADSQSKHIWKIIGDLISKLYAIHQEHSIVDIIRTYLNHKELELSLSRVQKEKKERDYYVAKAYRNYIYSVGQCQLFHDLFHSKSKLDSQLYITTIVWVLDVIIKDFIGELESSSKYYLIGRIGRFIKPSNGKNIEFQGPYDKNINFLDDYRWLKRRGKYYLDRKKSPEDLEFIRSFGQKYQSFLPKQMS